jgi:hypothetical protein
VPVTDIEKSIKLMSEDLASGRPAKKALVKPMGDTHNDNSKNFSVKPLKSLKMKEETFKPHDMWDENGKKHFAKTEKEHLAMKDKGWGHENPNKSEDNITELETKTLSNYVRKAVSPLSKKSVGNLASKGAHKLAHSDDFDAGEKEDAKSFQRAKGVIRATKKLAKRATQNEDFNDNEKRRAKALAGRKKAVVHSTKPDSLKTVKIKYNGPPIKTKVTDIGPGGKETVRKDWSEGYNIKDMAADLKPTYTPSNKPIPKHLQNQIASQFKDPKDKRIGEDIRARQVGIMKNLKTESSNDNYDPVVSDLRTKEKLKKAGLPKESPKVNEANHIVFDLNNMEESLANLVRRGVDKVVKAVDSANEKQPVSPSKKKLYNPVSGENIKKRVDSQKKR